jgi:hypothetical protein
MGPWLYDMSSLIVAGVDAARIRRAAPDLVMVGHFDKMAMNRGEAAIRTEFERRLPVMKTGWFIPSVNHQTPPHATLEEYRLYRRLLDEYTAAARR